MFLEEFPKNNLMFINTLWLLIEKGGKWREGDIAHERASRSFNIKAMKK